MMQHGDNNSCSEGYKVGEDEQYSWVEKVKRVGLNIRKKSFVCFSFSFVFLHFLAMSQLISSQDSLFAWNTK